MLPSAAGMSGLAGRRRRTWPLRSISISIGFRLTLLSSVADAYELRLFESSKSPLIAEEAASRSLRAWLEPAPARRLRLAFRDFVSVILMWPRSASPLRSLLLGVKRTRTLGLR